MTNKTLTINITGGTIIKAMLLFVLATLIWTLRDLVLIVLISIVIASAVDPAAKALLKYKIPRVISILTVYLGFFAFFFATMYFFVPLVLNEASGMIAELPSYIQSVETTAGEVGVPIGQAHSLSNAVAEMQKMFASLSEDMVSMVSAVFGGVLSFILVVVFSFYFAINEKGLQEFIRIITPLKHEKYVLSLLKRSQKKIGAWMQGQFLLMLIIGVLVFLGLTILGVKYALALAVMAAVFEIIPVFGPTLASIPAIALAFSSGGFALAIFVVIFYVVIQQFENHLIYPLVVTKVVGVPSILVILALVVGAQLAGVIGIILSVPAAAVLQEIFADMDKARHSNI